MWDVRLTEVEVAAAARVAAMSWLEGADTRPAPVAARLGIADLNTANVLWDGGRPNAPAQEIPRGSTMAG